MSATNVFQAELQTPDVSSSSSSSSGPAIEIDSTLTLNVTLPSLKAEVSINNVLLVLVVDKSGSMGSNLSSQVAPALEYMVEQSLQLPNITPVVVQYDTQAKKLDVSEKNYKNSLKGLRAGGGTTFSSAFELLNQIAKEVHSEKIKGIDEIVIGFLTDGQDTSSGQYENSFKTLKNQLIQLGIPSVVHSIAFTSGHDFAFLNRIRKDLGTVEGGFLYAEPSDGPEALRTKFESIFDVVANASVRANITLSLEGYDFVEFTVSDSTDASSSSAASSADISGVVMNRTKEHNTTVTLDRQFSHTITLPVRPSDASSSHAARPEPVLKIRAVPVVRGEKGKAAPQEIKKEVHPTLRIMPADFLGTLKLQQIETRLTAMSKALGRVSDAGKVPPTAVVEMWIKSVNQLHQMALEVSKSAFTGAKKSQRAKAFELIASTTTKVTGISSILTQLLKGGSLSTGISARLAELSFGGKFQQARRDRTMDARQQRNIEVLKKDEEALLAVEIDKEALKQFTEEQAETWKCILSQANFVEMLSEDNKDDRDVLGFGLAVGRPETVVDDPTQLRIDEVSITTIAHSTFNDSLKYAIDLQGALGAHGGFTMTSTAAFQGMGREPINSWLPLYINAEHWKLVQPQIRSSLGYLVTLDPFGFNGNQVEVFPLVLATMVTRLGDMGKQAIGEKELVLLFQFLRTTIALSGVASLGGLRNRGEKLLTAFFASPLNRFKDQVANLLVLMAYLLIVPVEQLDKIFVKEGDLDKFWVYVVAESVRRACDGVYRSGPEAEQEVLALLTSIIVPKVGQKALNSDELKAYFENLEKKGKAAAESKAQSSGASADKDAGNDRRPDPGPRPDSHASRGRGGSRGGRGGRGGGRGGRSQPDEESAPAPLDHGVASFPPIRERDAKMRAKGNNLVFGGSVSASAAVESDEDMFRPEDLTESLLDPLLGFLARNGGRFYPHVGAILSFVLFTRQWHKMQRQAGDLGTLLKEIDDNVGVAPASWIEGVKQAFAPRPAMKPYMTTLFELVHSPAGQSSSSSPLASSMQVIRASVAQGVRYRANKDAREAVEARKYLDVVTQATEIIQAEYTTVTAAQKAEQEKNKQEQVTAYALARAALTSDIFEFIGYMSDTEFGFGGKRNSYAFKQLYRQFCSEAKCREIALGPQKLRILLTGKYVDGDRSLDVLDGGKTWLPGTRKTHSRHTMNDRRLRNRWGQEYDAIRAEINGGSR
eukprot:TRINITY_DN1273_c0_g1_i1.p1 TRINITY_DN1273_c0_g1~~TRINITY_DN1273_c0_g1_i1.p1  ORF type:complete len:1247 (+),score=506.54 TRINITY_DN1273_c0_g1_i1:76-3741(+)